ncbi:MAG TPA: TetR/AcrR family transcriptional regulator [Allosphingosinicella sp.]|jgi:AcrR family transcriptional regulator
MADPNGGPGRPNQKRRTRKALIEAAARLMKEGGGKPSLEQIAEAALVSRATAYRYFPGVEPLLVEASLDIAMPEPDALFGEDAPLAPAERIKRVDEAVDSVVHANEAAIRTMLVHSLQHKLGGGGGDPLPARQNRRTALIEAALESADMDPEARDKLTKALALVIGSESMLVFRDVLQLDETDVRAVKDWTIDALVAAATR